MWGFYYLVLGALVRLLLLVVFVVCCKLYLVVIDKCLDSVTDKDRV